MDTESKKAAYHSPTYTVAGEAMMSFQPIKSIHQHLCAFHVYAYVPKLGDLAIVDSSCMGLGRIVLDMLKPITTATIALMTFTNVSFMIQTSPMLG